MYVFKISKYYAYNLSNNFAGMRLVSKHHWIAYAQAKAGAYSRIPQMIFPNC